MPIVDLLIALNTHAAASQIAPPFHPGTGIATPPWPAQAARRASGAVPRSCGQDKIARVLLESAGASLVYDVARLIDEPGRLQPGALGSRRAGRPKEGRGGRLTAGAGHVDHKVLRARKIAVAFHDDRGLVPGHGHRAFEGRSNAIRGNPPLTTVTGAASIRVTVLLGGIFDLGICLTSD